MHIYAEPRLQELIGCQMKILHSRFTFPLFFHALSRREEVIYEDKVVTVTAFPLKHHYDTPVSGFLSGKKTRKDYPERSDCGLERTDSIYAIPETRGRFYNSGGGDCG